MQQNQPVYQEPEYDPPEAQEPQELSGEDDSGGVTEISREDFPNKSGDGHGMYVITYSDGSVIYQDY